MADGEQDEGETLWDAAQRRAAEARAKRTDDVPFFAAPPVAPPATHEPTRVREVAAEQSLAEARALGVVEAARNDGVQAMVIGGLICAAGIVVTVLTYAAASEGGGHYIVSYGAIVGGAIQFIRGAVAYASG